DRKLIDRGLIYVCGEVLLLNIDGWRFTAHSYRLTPGSYRHLRIDRGDTSDFNHDILLVVRRKAGGIDLDLIDPRLEGGCAVRSSMAGGGYERLVGTAIGHRHLGVGNDCSLLVNDGPADCAFCF